MRTLLTFDWFASEKIKMANKEKNNQREDGAHQHNGCGTKETFVTTRVTGNDLFYGAQHEYWE